MELKFAFSERLVRTSDPDVFISPDSARIRARQLGCIGIRRYGTRNGENGGMAWMPCTNESDYRRRTGVGPQARRDKERTERQFVQRVLSNPNLSKPRKMRSLKSVENIYYHPQTEVKQSNLDIPESVSRLINSRIRQHNKQMDEMGNPKYSNVSYSVAADVWRRGYSLSIRSGNAKSKARVDGFTRLSRYMKLLDSERVLDLRSVSDVDLLPAGHPLGKRQSSRIVEQKSASSAYTKPMMRERLKRRIMASSKGGRPGQWSARKAQLLALEYRRSGGGYVGKRKKQQRALKKWTNEKWTTSDGKPAIQGSKTRRYLPQKAWSKLTPEQIRATNRKKIAGSKRGQQFVPNTRRAARASRSIRGNRV